MVITTIKFKRKQEFDWEAGIKIEGTLATKYLDAEGQEVKNVYDYKDIPSYLFLYVKPLLKEIKQKLK